MSQRDGRRRSDLIDHVCVRPHPRRPRGRAAGTHSCFLSDLHVGRFRASFLTLKDHNLGRHRGRLCHRSPRTPGRSGAMPCRADPCGRRPASGRRRLRTNPTRKARLPPPGLPPPLCSLFDSVLLTVTGNKESRQVCFHEGAVTHGLSDDPGNVVESGALSFFRHMRIRKTKPAEDDDL